MAYANGSRVVVLRNSLKLEMSWIAGQAATALGDNRCPHRRKFVLGGNSNLFTNSAPFVSEHEARRSLHAMIHDEVTVQWL